jgi:hypothetical protein
MSHAWAPLARDKGLGLGWQCSLNSSPASSRAACCFEAVRGALGSRSWCYELLAYLQLQLQHIPHPTYTCKHANANAVLRMLLLLLLLCLCLFSVLPAQVRAEVGGPPPPLAIGRVHSL